MQNLFEVESIVVKTLGSKCWIILFR